MKRLIFSLVLLIPVFIGCTLNEKPTEITYFSLSTTAAYGRFLGDEEIILIDVRTADEFNLKFIPGSINIALNDVEQKVPSLVTEKNSIIFVICRAGNRSASAAKILADLGFSHVYDVGGINDWPGIVESK